MEYSLSYDIHVTFKFFFLGGEVAKIVVVTSNNGDDHGDTEIPCLDIEIWIHHLDVDDPIHQQLNAFRGFHSHGGTQ